jgi:hypothetical protein
MVAAEELDRMMECAKQPPSLVEFFRSTARRSSTNLGSVGTDGPCSYRAYAFRDDAPSAFAACASDSPCASRSVRR